MECWTWAASLWLNEWASSCHDMLGESHYGVYSLSTCFLRAKIKFFLKKQTQIKSKLNFLNKKTTPLFFTINKFVNNKNKHFNKHDFSRQKCWFLLSKNNTNSFLCLFLIKIFFYLNLWTINEVSLLIHCRFHSDRSVDVSSFRLLTFKLVLFLVFRWVKMRASIVIVGLKWTSLCCVLNS